MTVCEVDVHELATLPACRHTGPPPPGRYHVMCTDTRDLPGGGVRVTFRVCDGWPRGQQGAEFTECFRTPDVADARQRVFRRRRLALLARATGLVRQAESSAVIAWEQLRGRQCVVHVVRDPGRGVQVDGLQIYGIFEPAAADIPKRLEDLVA